MEQEKKRILRDLELGKMSSDEAFEALQKINENEAQARKVKNGEYKQESLISTISGVIDKAIKKVKELDVDFNFGDPIYVTKDYIIDHEISKINVEITNGSIQLQTHAAEEIKLACNASVYSVDTAQKAEENFEESFSLTERENELQVKLKNRKIKNDITLLVPQRLYEKIALRTYNGTINVENCNIEKLKSKTGNGPIYITNIDGLKVVAETLNGEIKVDNSRGETCAAETINGKIIYNSCHATCDFRTTNGKIVYRLTDFVEGEASFKSETGKIEITIPQELRLQGKLRTNVGGIKSKLENMVILSDKKEVVKKEVHFVANEELKSTFTVDAETKVGSIKITHDKHHN